MDDAIIKFDFVESKIIELRGQKVILDRDVAEIYGVETMRINEAVKNNPNKFPKGYFIELTKKEKTEVIENFDNPKLKFSPTLPKAFTEKGLYMLATILKSAKATQTTIAIVETFARIRELTRTVAELFDSTEESKQKKLMHKSGEIISGILADDVMLTDTETSIELNFAVLKIKHTIKRKSDNNSK